MERLLDFKVIVKTYFSVESASKQQKLYKNVYYRFLL